MDEKSQSEKSNPEPSSNAVSPGGPLTGNSFRSKNVSPQTLVIAELQRISPAAIGQLSAPMLDLLNLTDITEAGAEMIGSPIWSRLWDEEGNLRQPFPVLIEWYLNRRPVSYDPLTVASFTVRAAAVVTAIEAALEEGR
jgi:hypothetical protein